MEADTPHQVSMSCTQSHQEADPTGQVEMDMLVMLVMVDLILLVMLVMVDLLVMLVTEEIEQMLHLGKLHLSILHLSMDQKRLVEQMW